MAKTKYYAVANGYTMGIFLTWSQCEASVKGFPNAKYKSFTNLSDAEKYLINYIEENDKNVCEDNEIKDHFHSDICAYVDGSYNSNKKAYGSGVVIIKDEEVIKEMSIIGNNSSWAEMRNVAGEIKAAILAMNYAASKGYKSITIFYDYQGIESWATGEWKAKKECTKSYKEYFDEISKIIDVSFIKVKAHSGDKYNNMADRLAGELLN